MFQLQIIIFHAWSAAQTLRVELKSLQKINSVIFPVSLVTVMLEGSVCSLRMMTFNAEGSKCEHLNHF